MKPNSAAILSKLTPLLSQVKRYRFIAAFLVFSIMYGYIITQVNQISSTEPTEKQITDQATSAPRTKVDPKLADKLQSFEDQNIQTKSIFNEARKNPFSE